MKVDFLRNKVSPCVTGIRSEYFADHFPKLYLSSEQGAPVSCWLLCSVVGTVLQGSSDRETERFPWPLIYRRTQKQACAKKHTHTHINTHTHTRTHTHTHTHTQHKDKDTLSCAFDIHTPT